MLLAGLDIGTTGCKLTVYSCDGKYLGRVYRDYPAVRKKSEHEVDAGLIWKGAQEVLAEASTNWPNICAIGITSFGESFVLLDEDDNPLAPVMLYTDPRGGDECRQLCHTVGKETLAEITGVNPHPMYSISKVMWMKKHRTDIFAKTARICLIADYIIYMLTGRAQIDYSLAARTMAFDIKELCWSRTVLKAADIDSALFSNALPAGSAALTVKYETAERLGLSADVKFVCAGHDQVAAAVGSGVFDEGTAVDGAGTVECITPVFDDIPESKAMAEGSYAVVPHAERGKYVCYAFSFTGGALLKWFTDTLAGYAAIEAERKNISVYSQLGDDSIADCPTGIMILPHFAGAATPYMDYGSKGAIIGLTLSTGLKDIFRAIMEGVCYEMRLNTEFLRKAGINIGSLKATGGGATNRIWMQMKADVLGIPVTALSSSEAGGMGAAMMAGAAVGIFKDLRTAAQKMVTEKETYHPRQDVHDKYSEVYARYKKVYGAVRPLV